MGFSPDLFAFLSELADHNDRAWFTANKPRYETAVKQAALDFIDDFGPLLAEISPYYRAIGKGKGSSLFRIYRDTRFSKDKTPYKTHTGMHFRHVNSGGDVHAPGFYLHIEPGNVMVGVGIWKPASPVLKAIRTKIVAEPDRWTAVKDAVAATDLDWMAGESLKRAPKGFDPDHLHIEDLRRKSLAVHGALTADDVLAPDFGQRLQAAFEDGAEVVRFLCEACDQPF